MEVGRWCLRCSDACEDCSVSIAGAYDEVLSEGAAHWRLAHGARGDEKEIREAVSGLMRREDFDWLWPAGALGDGDHPAGRPDWPF